MTTTIVKTRRHRRRTRADPRLRLAVRLQDLLMREVGSWTFAYPATRVHETSAGLLRLLRSAAWAYERRWESAISNLVSRIPAAAELLGGAVSALACVARTGGRRSLLPISLRHLHDELLALEREFGEVEVDLREARLAVETEPIELEDQYLGPFRIELRLPQLKLVNRGREGRGRGAVRIPGQWQGRAIDCSAFFCVALDPHPAACSEGTTHPHVRDESPCLGDATGVVTAALLEGRLCDAFLAVQAVLKTYNAGSPFVSLDEWDGQGCSDCGRITSRDDLYACSNCDAELCDGCSRCCDNCDQTFCLSCLERAADDERLCESCRGTCSDCGGIYANRLLESNDGRCADCAERDAEAQRESVDADDEEGEASPPVRNPLAPVATLTTVQPLADITIPVLETIPAAGASSDPPDSSSTEISHESSQHSAGLAPVADLATAGSDVASNAA